MAQPRSGFDGLLREWRLRARLTQEELAAAAGVSLRAVSNLERGAATTPQQETVRVLADALHLTGAERSLFEAVARGRPPAEGQAAAAAAVRALPRDVSSFTGRQRELEQLTTSVAAAGGGVGIHAIGGMAGVGKTAFAVRAAHRLAGQFPGGPVFLPLHGHTPGRAPVDPADALASLLLAVGVPPARLPPGLEERAALWRDQVAGQPLLLVLDDAAGSEQVLPLLPGAGGSLVLVTSRRHLTALDDVAAISLDTLPPGEAAALLVRLAGRRGLSAGDPGVADMTGLCGFLPLAVGMMARQLRHHPAWSVTGRAAELAAARDRLALMTTDNLSVAAAFDLSYAHLGPDLQRLFRRLALHPGTDIDVYAAAALDGTALTAARRGLEALYDQYLLSEPARGRYRPHDLVREHARALASRLDPEEDQEAALTRLLDYYQHTAAVANGRVARLPRPGPAPAGAGPAAVPALADYEQALTWVTVERPSLLACLDYAGAAGQHARVLALTAGLSGLWWTHGPWADAIARHTAAVQVARQLGDQLAEANALTDLGRIRIGTADYPAAAQALGEALGLYRGLGNALGQAYALAGLGQMLGYKSDYPAATRAMTEALDLYRDLGDRGGQARVLTDLGHAYYVMNDYPAAVRAMAEALDICRGLGDRLGQASALNFLGFVWHVTGDYQAAVRAHEEALGIGRSLGNWYAQGYALFGLGQVRQVTGDYPGALRAHEEALASFRDMGSRTGVANALLGIGSAQTMTGDYPAAASNLDEALGFYRDVGDRGGEASALNERGTLDRVRGELTLARGCYQQALELSRAIPDVWDEAHALAGLGRCAVAAGQAGPGAALLRQALEILQRIGAAEARDVRAEVDALSGPRAG
jgi:tetratricopeptide (TPR) repeat protein/transcriptional regulator with XRE-family HTH domain